MPACVERRIEREILRACERFQVSRSFVISTALADYFGIDIDEPFTAVRRTRKVRRAAHDDDPPMYPSARKAGPK